MIYAPSVASSSELSTAPGRVSTPSAAPPPETHFLRRHAGKLIFSALIGVGLVGMLQKVGMKIIPPTSSFAAVKWWVVPIYVVTLAAMSYFRATRWRYLLRAVVDVPKLRLVVVSWVGFAAILLAPFRIGEFVRPYMLQAGGPAKHKNGETKTMSLAMATGSVVAERVADLLYLSLVLAIALLAIPMRTSLDTKVVGIGLTVAEVRHAGFAMLGLALCVFVVIAIYYFARDFARRLTLAVWGVVSRPLGEKLAGIAEKLADGLHFLGSPRDAVPFLAETTLYWGFNVFGMWLLAWGCGVVHLDGTGITPGETCALMGMLGVTILIPGPPGLLGVFQAGIYAGMTMYFPQSVVMGAGAAYVFLLYASQFLWTALAGLGCLLFQRGALRSLQRAEGEIEHGS